MLRAIARVISSLGSMKLGELTGLEGAPRMEGPPAAMLQLTDGLRHVSRRRVIDECLMITFGMVVRLLRLWREWYGGEEKRGRIRRARKS